MPEDKTKVHEKVKGDSILKSRKETELISPEMMEIISYRPHWIIRKGNIIFFLILCGLVGVSWIIKYPDIINGSLRIAALGAPKFVSSRAEGKLEKLLVKNGDFVKENEALAIIQSTSNYTELMQLENWIGEAEQNILHDSMQEIFRNGIPIIEDLGELQPFYENFKVDYNEAKQTFTNGYYSKKIAELQKDLVYQKELRENLARQKELHERAYSLQKVEYNAKEYLAKEKVIAPLEFNQDKNNLLIKEQTVVQMDAQMINNSLSLQNKSKEILELKKSITDLQIKFYSSLLNLKNKIREWKYKYVLTAPESGKVEYLSFIQENQYVASGQEMFYVQPKNSTYYGEMMAPQSGAGKLRLHQKVMIKVESYPEAEYGYLTGDITYISEIPNPRDSFLIRVELPAGLVSNYGKQFYFRNQMRATAEVITDNRKLIDRFAGRLKEMVNRN